MIDYLELGEPKVGQKVLHAVARLLPGWTIDTPRAILEEGSVPPVGASVAAVEPDDINEEMLVHLREQRRFLLGLDATDQELAEYLESLERMWKGRERNSGRFRRTSERFAEEVALEERQGTTSRSHPNGSS